MATPSLEGKRVLLVEDEYLIVSDMVRAFQACGAEIVGPVASVAAALALIDEAGEIDGAVLDLNLQGEMAFPVAERLVAMAVPFVFATGYDKTAIPEHHRNVECCQKPVAPSVVAQLLFFRKV